MASLSLSPFTKLLIFVIQIYQLIISPLVGYRCRFYPTCSYYSIESLYSFGLFKGIFLTVKRILKCSPLHSGGYDPIPNKNVIIRDN